MSTTAYDLRRRAATTFVDLAGRQSRENERARYLALARCQLSLPEWELLWDLIQWARGGDDA